MNVNGGNVAIEAYVAALTDSRRERVDSVVSYIRNRYAAFIANCDYAPKTKFPVFKTPNDDNYVGIASQKQYVAIHFGRYHCAEIVTEADSRIKTGVGCAKIPDSVPFPLEHIKRAVDACFKEN
jgi:hypothetical protein